MSIVVYPFVLEDIGYMKVELREPCLMVATLTGGVSAAPDSLFDLIGS